MQDMYRSAGPSTALNLLDSERTAHCTLLCVYVSDAQADVFTCYPVPLQVALFSCVAEAYNNTSTPATAAPLVSATSSPRQGIIAGAIVAGVLLLLVLIAGALLFVWCRRQSGRHNAATATLPTTAAVVPKAIELAAAVSSMPVVHANIGDAPPFSRSPTASATSGTSPDLPL